MEAHSYEGHRLISQASSLHGHAALLVLQAWQLQENPPKLVKVKLSLKTKIFKLTELLVCLHNSIYTVGFAGMSVMMGRRKIFPPAVFIDTELLANFKGKTTFRVAKLYSA